MKRTPPYYQKMTSGNQAIVLEAEVKYDDFTALAQKWAKRLCLDVEKKVDGVSERLWECRLSGSGFWLAWDDWMFELSLEPKDDAAGKLIADIGRELGINSDPNSISGDQ